MILLGGVKHCGRDDLGIDGAGEAL
jgi:hypothetical protein